MNNLDYYEMKQSLECEFNEDPINDDIMCKLASAMMETGDMEGALNILLHAVEVKPNIQTFSNLGFFYLREGEPNEGVWNYQVKKAINILSMAIKLEPKTYIPYALLGEAYITEKHFMQAQNVLKTATEMAATTENYNNLGVAFFKHGNYKEAVQSFQKAHLLAKKNDYFYNPYLNYAICLSKLNRNLEAEEVAEYLVRRHEELPSLDMTNIAKVFYWSKNYRRTAEIFEKALEEYVLSINDFGMYVSSLFKLNLYKDAEKIFIDAVKNLQECIDEINEDDEVNEDLKRKRVISLENEIIEYKSMYTNVENGNIIEFFYDPVIEQPCYFFGCLRHNISNYKQN